MNRRNFAKRFLAAVGGLVVSPLAMFGAIREPNILDGKYHRLLIVGDKATVDGVPTPNPWLKVWLSNDDRMKIWARPGIVFDVKWLRWHGPIDRSGPPIFEAEFMAYKTDNPTVTIAGWRLEA